MVLNNIILFLDLVYKSSEGGSGFDGWEFFKDLLTLFSGFVLLWIAIRSYLHQDLKKNLLNKQLETVFQLYEAMEKTEFHLGSEKRTADGTSMGIREFKFHEINKILKSDFCKEPLRNPNIIISDGIVYQMDFVKFHNNIFIPEPIAAQLKKFSTLTFDIAKKPLDVDNFAVLKKPYEVVDTDKPMGQVLTNPTYKTAESYLKDILKLKAEIKNWCKKKGGEAINI